MIDDTQYIALLRGINVAGKNLLSMNRLCELAAQLERTEITTSVQSGNIVFRARDMLQAWEKWSLP